MKPKVIYHFYVINDNIFDLMVWDDTSGADCEAVTCLDPDTNDIHSIFRASYWPKKYTKNVTVPVKTFLNSFNKLGLCYKLVLHELGHGVLNLEHSSKSSIMQDGLRDIDIDMKDAITITKELLKHIAYIKIHMGVIPI